MRWHSLREALFRIHGLFGRVRAERELDEELRAHVEMLVDEHVRSGKSLEEARRDALRSFGGVDSAKEAYRDQRGLPWLDVLVQDVRFGLRMFGASPTFTAVVLTTLALSIGASTTIFSVTDAVLLRPLPLREPDRLISFWLTAPAKRMNVVDLTPGFFAVVRDRSRAFEALAAYDVETVTLTRSGEPEQLNAAFVSPDYFKLLGVKPLRGRGFLPEEETPGKGRVAVLSFAFWQRKFGGDAGIVGRSVDLDGRAREIVGIMPPGFAFPHAAEQAGFPERLDLWMPLELDRENISYFNYLCVARLRAGADQGQARREVQQVWDDFARDHEAGLGAGALGPGAAVVMMRLEQKIVGDVRMPLFVLLGGVTLLLLIACANIANLLLARASSRRREIALRSCLGAGPRRILRQFMTESLLLVGSGAGAGLMLAGWAVAGLRSGPIAKLPPMPSAQIDARTALIALATMVVTALLVGFAPALWCSRVDLHRAIKEGGRGSASRSERRANDSLAAAQFALSLLLLLSTGLLARSFWNLASVDPGFEPRNVWTAQLALPQDRYDDDAKVRAFYGRLLERVRSLPGVASAALCQIVPFSGNGGGYAFTVEGHQPLPGEPSRDAWGRSVTPDYFRTIGIRVLRGRSFDDGDTARSLPVAIVDEKLARHYWPDEDPIGERIKVGGASSSEPWLQIVGVVASVKNRRLDEDAKFYFYRPDSQWVRRDTSLVLKTTVDPASMTSAVRGALRSMNPELPLFDVSTVERFVARSLGTRRLTLGLLAGFAAAALLLAMIGVYGVMSLNVGGRRDEFGVRLALGARPRQIVTLVLTRGMTLAGAGMGVGLIGALLSAGMLRSLLYGVAPIDAATFAGGTAALTLAAIVASYLPARRAARVDPLAALRSE